MTSTDTSASTTSQTTPQRDTRESARTQALAAAAAAANSKNAAGNANTNNSLIESQLVNQFWTNIHSSLVHPIGFGFKVGYDIFIDPNNKQKILPEEYENYKNVENFKNCKREAFTFNLKMKELSKIARKRNKIETEKLVVKTPEVSAKKLKLAQSSSKGSASAVASQPNAQTSLSANANSQSPTISSDDPMSPEVQILEMKKPPTFQQASASQNLRFEVGMKLEAVNPLNLYCIGPATIKKVLKRDYLIITIDGSNESNENQQLTEFCYHSKSSMIMPAGFCELAGIKLTSPEGWPINDFFTWDNYLKFLVKKASENGTAEAQPKPKLAPPQLFSNKQPEILFQVGQKLEAVDLMQPNLICVATVKQVACKLIRIGFDGWGSEYDQWVDVESPDIYPIGYSEMVGEKLQPLGQPIKSNKNSNKKVSPVGTKNNKTSRKLIRAN